jgi:NTE family protein
MATKYPFRNLVFEGGGVKGIAYIGAIEALDKAGVLDQIERVAGTSAGAITALLMSFRLDVDETLRLFNSLDFSKISQQLAHIPPGSSSFWKRLVLKLFGDLESLERLRTRWGWFASAYFYNWLEEVIAGQCDGNRRATFQDFNKKDFRDLFVVASNVSRQEMAVFSKETTPDVAVADAVRMSMSIPLYFEALQFDGKKLGKQGDYYADGGILNNFPIHLFDHPQYSHDDRWYHEDVNWETLGLHLYTPENCPQLRVPIEDILSYAEELFATLLEAQTLEFTKELIDQKRSVNISNCCVKPTEFDIKPGSERFKKLVKAGSEAAADYLASYEPPQFT